MCNPVLHTWMPTNALRVLMDESTEFPCLRPATVLDYALCASNTFNPRGALALIWAQHVWTYDQHFEN